MDRSEPLWQPFDPSEPSLPGALDTGDGGRVVAVVASRGMEENGWCPDAAVGLARAWAGRHDRVLLADVELERPRLHRTLGVDNREGVSDMLLWGASVGRVARPVNGILFASAGTPVADVASVLESGRWSVLTEAFRRAGAGLLLYVTRDTPGLDHLLDHASAVVLLAPPDVDPTLALEHREVAVALGPPGAAPALAAAPAGARGGEERGTGGDAGDVGPGVEGEAAPAPARTGPRPEEEGWEDEIAASVSAAEGRRSRRTTWIVVVLVLLVAVLLLAVLGLIRIPVLTPLLGGMLDRRSG